MQKVSVIIPAYNVERYISRCIESVVRQTYTEIEILVVNDGSTDGSTKIIELWTEKDSRIKHIRQVNSGLSAARNTGMAKISGDYVMFVDGDDYIAENCVEASIYQMQKDNDIDIVCFPYVKVFRSTKKVVKLFPRDCVFGQNVVKNTLLRKLIGPTDEEICRPGEISRLNTAWGKLYRTSAIENEGFVDTKIIGVEDGWFNINIFNKVRKVAYIEECYYFYEKENASSLLHGYDTKYFERRKQAYKLIRSFLKENDLKQWEKYLDNRIVIEFIEIYRRIINSNIRHRKKEIEIKKVLSDTQYFSAISEFNVKVCPLIWKVFWKLCRGKHYKILADLSGVAILCQRVLQWRK